MSNLEHYFENLLFNGQGVKGDWNKNALTEAEQKAVEICVDYVLYNLFLNRDDFMKFVSGKDINATTNADRIRGKDDEDLAEFIYSEMFIIPWCDMDCGNVEEPPCRQCILKWLKQEAK